SQYLACHKANLHTYIKRPHPERGFISNNNIANTTTTTTRIFSSKLIQSKVSAMAVLPSFMISCFSGSSKVASEGEDSRRTSTQVKAGGEAKLKESKAKKSPPIPMTYFPIGSTFSRL
ncbi:hypothetical protein QQP08_020124, partial [Theobroma cacao]